MPAHLLSTIFFYKQQGPKLPSTNPIPISEPIAPPAPVQAASQIGNKDAVGIAIFIAIALPMPPPIKVPDKIEAIAEADRFSIPPETATISFKLSS